MSSVRSAQQQGTRPDRELQINVSIFFVRFASQRLFWYECGWEVNPPWWLRVGLDPRMRVCPVRVPRRLDDDDRNDHARVIGFLVRILFFLLPKKCPILVPSICIVKQGVKVRVMRVL